MDQRVSAAIITASECAALLAALVILLSMIVNVSALLIPAGIALAFAAKDLSHNFVAGAALWLCTPYAVVAWLASAAIAHAVRVVFYPACLCNACLLSVVRSVSTCLRDARSPAILEAVAHTT